MKRLSLMLVFVAACHDITAPVIVIQTPPWAQVGFDRVQACVGHPPLVGLESIKFFGVVPTLKQEQFSSGTDEPMSTRVELDGKVWMSTNLNDQYYQWMWEHEMAHIMYQVHDHPDSVFKNCNLLPSQH